MDPKDFRNIVGEAKADQVATIRFFGKITEESATRFNNEFDYLENCVKPSLIRILINCEGGSVLHGMSSYSTIQYSNIPTECIIEGLAASMGSVIWAAGDVSLMRDYSILMIHNPFLPGDTEDKASDLVMAFTNQIKTIYSKRFGLTPEHIDSIMTGEAGKDGTFFDSKAAVKAGIIAKKNVLNTSKQLCEKVRNEVLTLSDTSLMQSALEKICAEAPSLETENKHLQEPDAIPKQKNTPNNVQSMNDEKKPSAEYSAVAASLGFKDGCEVKDVMARISELVGVEAKLETTRKELTDAQTVIAGKDATIGNLQKSVDELTASLTEYKTKEEQAQQQRIEQMVEAAINDGKIDKADKASWVEMATSNYALAENTLASIPAREQISKEIATDTANVQAATAAAATRSAEDLMAEKVLAVVGKDFEFKSIS